MTSSHQTITVRIRVEPPSLLHAQDTSGSSDSSSNHFSAPLHLTVEIDDPFFLAVYKEYLTVTQSSYSRREVMSLGLFMELFQKMSLKRKGAPPPIRSVSSFTTVEESLQKLISSGAMIDPERRSAEIAAVLENAQSMCLSLLSFTEAGYRMAVAKEEDSVLHHLSGDHCLFLRLCGSMFGALYHKLPEIVNLKNIQEPPFERFFCTADHQSAVLKLTMLFGRFSLSHMEELRTYIRLMTMDDAYFLAPSDTCYSGLHPRTLSHLSDRVGKVVFSTQDTQTLCTENKMPNPNGIAFSTRDKPADLLRSVPIWEEEKSWCALCYEIEKKKQHFKSWFHPSGPLSHHCRACGRRICMKCVSQKKCFDASFATLRHPIKEDSIGKGRIICCDCEKLYLQRRSYRPLIVLFIAGGLSLLDLAILRAGEMWRGAADTCLTEYRSVLHTCEGSLKSMSSPLGNLLWNSLELILSDHKCRGVSGYLHREPALLLLRYVSENGLWEHEQFPRLLEAIIKETRYVPPEATEQKTIRKEVSHFHLLCTGACETMSPVYFAIKTIEYLLPCMTRSKGGTCGTIQHILENTLERLCQQSGEYEAPEGSHLKGFKPLTKRAAAQLEYLTLCILHLFYRATTLHPSDGPFFFRHLIVPLVSADRQCGVTVSMFFLLHRADTELCAYLPTLQKFVIPTWWNQLMASHHFWDSWTKYLLRARSNKREWKGLPETFDTWIQRYCTEGGAGLAPETEYWDLPQPIPNPFTPHRLFLSVRAKARGLGGTAAGAIWIRFSSRSAEESVQPHANPQEVQQDILFKFSSVEKDQLMCLSVKLLQDILHLQLTSKEDEPCPLPSYGAFPLHAEMGLVEKVDGKTAGELHSITKYIESLHSRCLSMYWKSAKFFLVLNYLFDIGDRHKDNVMVNREGAMFHLDFGFVLSEKTLAESIVGTAIRLDDDILGPIRGGGDFAGEKSAVVESFYLQAAEWYLLAQHHADVFAQLWRCLSVGLDPSFSRSAHGTTTHVDPHRGGAVDGCLHPLLPQESYIADTFNRLFDRHCSWVFRKFIFMRTMRSSVNACRFKDHTRSIASTASAIFSPFKK